MASNQEEVRRAALAEIARRELERRARESTNTSRGGSFLRGFAQGITSNFGDEIGAQAARREEMELPLAQQSHVDPFQPTLEAIRGKLATDVAAHPVASAAGNIAGAVTQGGIAGGAGATLLSGSKSIPGAIGRGAAEGAIYGAAAGAGAGNTGEERLRGALSGGASGAASGAAFGALSGTAAAFLGKKRVPELDELFAAKNAAYDAAEQSGVVIRQDVAQKAHAAMRRELAEAGLDPMLHPDTTRVLTRIGEDIDAGPLTFRQADTLRQIASDASRSSNPKDQRTAIILRNAVDRFVNGLKASDVTGPDPRSAIESLNAARALYRRYSNGEMIKELMERADLRASAFHGSGYENAVRTEFRNFAMNRAEMRRFSPAERSAIERVARGGNTRANLANVFRAIGKFAPRGAMSTTLSTALGAGGGFAIDGPAGAAVGPAAVMGIGEIGRQAATGLTARNARLVSELMRRGAPAGALGIPGLAGALVSGSAVTPQQIEDPNKRIAALLLQGRN